MFEREPGPGRTVPDVLDALIQHWAGTPLLIDGSEPTTAWAAERGYAIILSALQTPESPRYACTCSPNKVPRVRLPPKFCHA